MSFQPTHSGICNIISPNHTIMALRAATQRHILFIRMRVCLYIFVSILATSHQFTRNELHYVRVSCSTCHLIHSSHFLSARRMGLVPRPLPVCLLSLDWTIPFGSMIFYGVGWSVGSFTHSNWPIRSQLLLRFCCCMAKCTRNPNVSKAVRLHRKTTTQTKEKLIKETGGRRDVRSEDAIQDDNNGPQSKKERQIHTHTHTHLYQFNPLVHVLALYPFQWTCSL